MPIRWVTVARTVSMSTTLARLRPVVTASAMPAAALREAMSMEVAESMWLA